MLLTLMGLSFAAGVVVGIQIASLPLIGGILALSAAGAVAARPRRRRSRDLLRTRTYDDDILERGRMARRVRDRRSHRRRHP